MAISRVGLRLLIGRPFSNGSSIFRAYSHFRSLLPEKR
jgi:hypothetical protein